MVFKAELCASPRNDDGRAIPHATLPHRSISFPSPRRERKAKMERAARPQLAHLESILRELSNHEQRTNLQSVEQASIRTQQRLLKEQLLQGSCLSLLYWLLCVRMCVGELKLFSVCVLVGVAPAQEELATAQSSTATLCETIGSLQQAKDEREQEIAQLKFDLHASRDAQSTLMRKVARLEDETRGMKRNYIRYDEVCGLVLCFGGVVCH